MDIDTPRIKMKITELQKQISSSFALKSNITFAFKTAVSNFLSSPKLYMAIPIIIFFILIFTRPSFIKNTTYNPKTKQEKISVSFKKLFMYWLIISFLLVLGLFGFNYKTKKE